MCKQNEPSSSDEKAKCSNTSSDEKAPTTDDAVTSPSTSTTASTPMPSSSSSSKPKRRRLKREKQSELEERARRAKLRRKVQSRHAKAQKKQNEDSNPLMALLPSLGILVVGAFAVMAKMGFRGRPTTAGIDLGTTNSVICVQSPSKSVGSIDCISDPETGSPIIPSVVSFLERAIPHSSPPRYNLVGQKAKDRIDTFPKTTFYHAKRVIGRRYSDPAISELRHEVPFDIQHNEVNDTAQFYSPLSKVQSPANIGSHVISYLIEIAALYDRAFSSLTSAVIAIPAEFTMEQRIDTIMAFKLAGIKVARVLEEPTAAALAYGLDQKEGVEHILVYDFGGGTLDVSVLRVSPDGFVDVMGSAGDSELGGVDFDTKVADVLLEREKESVLTSKQEDAYSAQMGTCAQLLEMHVCTETAVRTMAERMKINISQLMDRDNYDEESEESIVVEDKCLTLTSSASAESTTKMTSPEDCSKFFVPHTIALEATQYETAVSSLYPRSVLPIRNVLKDLSMIIEDIDEVVMVGGTTRMPQIRSLVLKEFEGVITSLNTEIDPDITVAYGAASVID